VWCERAYARSHHTPRGANKNVLKLIWDGRILLFSIALAETIAANGERVGVMGQTIKSGAGEQIVVEDFGPFCKGAVAGDDERAAFIAFGDDFVQILNGLRRKRLQPEIVQDE